MSIDKDDLIPPSPSAEVYRIDEDQGEVFTSEDPFEIFRQWLLLARDKEMNDPNAMALATIDATGFPDVRIVLMKDFDERGVTFYTNTKSAKGEAMASTPSAALCFHWKSIRRQVRFRGTVERVSNEDADAYFSTRARGAQIGAWASDQSRPLKNRDILVGAVEGYEKQYAGVDVPRPAHWHGFRVVPSDIEFWVNRPYRLHDRVQFSRIQIDKPWRKISLYP